jgi:alpha-N-arabinofuranosidase
MLKHCADHMQLISEHFYCREIADSVPAHVAQIPDRVRAKAEAHRRYRQTIPGLAEKDVRIAMDEWNYWHRPYVYGELGCVYDLADAMGVAVGLHEYFRNSDIIAMAHYAQTVNVIGCVKTTKTKAFFGATGLPLRLYRHRFGTVPIALSGDHALLGVDAAAAWTEDRKAITLGLVNPRAEAEALALKIDGAALAGEATAWVIAGDDPGAQNDSTHQRLKIVEQPARIDGGTLRVAPLSITVVRLPVRATGERETAEPIRRGVKIEVQQAGELVLVKASLGGSNGHSLTTLPLERSPSDGKSSYLGGA